MKKKSFRDRSGVTLPAIPEVAIRQRRERRVRNYRLTVNRITDAILCERNRLAPDDTRWHTLSDRLQRLLQRLFILDNLLAADLLVEHERVVRAAPARRANPLLI